MARYRQNLRVAYQVYDGIAYLVEPERRTMHRLDEAATLIWEALAEPADAEAVAGRLTEAFEVGYDEALADTRAFLGELASRGLATIE
jgi:hypothetical protein